MVWRGIDGGFAFLRNRGCAGCWFFGVWEFVLWVFLGFEDGVLYGNVRDMFCIKSTGGILCMKMLDGWGKGICGVINPVLHR